MHTIGVTGIHTGSENPATNVSGLLVFIYLLIYLFIGLKGTLHEGWASKSGKKDLKSNK